MALAKRDPESFLAQRLASNETSIRIRALKTLRKYISLRSQKIEGGFTSDDLLKIWKGLFYCLWMQDKPLLQEELSDQISGLMNSFCTTESQLLYFETFLQTLKREWNGIDRLRMDKFFQLVRFVFRQAFGMLKRKEWETSMVNNFLKVFTTHLLQSREGIPNGLVLHILDVYMTELANIGSAELTADQNLTFIDPFCNTMAKSKDRRLVTSISKHIFSSIVDQASFAIEDLRKELCEGRGADSDSGQASEDEEETVEQDELKINWRANVVNGVPKKSNQGSQDEIPIMEDARPDEEPNNEDPEHVLQFDYGAIADRLFELGSRKNATNFNRTRMYSMVKIFRDLSEGVFPQDEDEDEPDSSEDELFNQKKDKKKRKRKGAEEGTLAKKHKESFAAKLAVLPQKTACEVGEKPSEANQINASSTSADDGESQAQDDELGLQRQVKANSKDKKRKGKKPKSDIPDVGEEAAPQSLLISKDMNKELILVDEGVKRHPIPKTVAEDKGGKEQTTTLSSNGKKHKKKWAGKQISECASDILENSQHLEEFSDHTPLKNKKKKSVLAGEESIRGVEVKMSREAEVPLKRCTNKRPADPSRALPLQMYPSEDQTNSATCVLRKKTKHKKKMIMKMRADAKIVNSLLEKTCADVQAEYVSSHPPAAVVITTGCQSSNTTAPLLMNKKSKKLKSKGKTRETASCGDVDMSSDCTDNKINCIEALNADAVKHSKLRSTKKQKKKKCISSQEQEFGVDMEQSVDALCAAQTNAVKRSSSTPTPLQKKKTQKRKEQLAVCLTGELNMGVQPTKDNCITKEHEDVEWSTTVIPKKKLKMKKGLQEANFISFEGKMTPPNPLFCKTKPKGWSTPLSSIKAFHTQQSETKKVTFGLKNNKTTEFRKTDWSLLVSPVGSSRVAFDPKKMPVSSMLKSPALSPALSPVVSVKKTVSRKRPTAADFF